MKRYTLPIDLEIIDSEENVSIDMSKVNLDVPVERLKKSAFIYLRNTGIHAVLDFSDCSFEDKEEYLKLFLTEDIEVDSKILANTWIEILCSRDGGGVKLPSILNAEEIKKFIVRNKDLMDAAYRLINSLPIYSMYCSPLNGSAFNVDDIPKTDDHLIKITNFSKLSEYNAFMMLIDGTTPGRFYTKLFIKDERHIVEMMDRLPFLNLLTALFAPQEVQTQIVNRLNEALTPPVINPNKRKEESPGEC